MKRIIRETAAFFWDAGDSFFTDQAFLYSAALSFFTVLSLSPLLIIVVSVGGFFSPELSSQFIASIQTIVGSRASVIISTVLANAREHQFAGTISAVISVGIVLLTATTVFVNLQKTMNLIWHVQLDTTNRIKGFFRRRLISLVMVMSIGALFLLSIIATTAMEFLLPSSGLLFRIVNGAVSFMLYTLLFALLFKYVPDVTITWHDVIIGAIITATLFHLGHYGVRKYLTYSTLAASFGAAGSLVVLLLFVYYSSLIFMFGVEMTQVYTSRYGSQMLPRNGT